MNKRIALPLLGAALAFLGGCAITPPSVEYIGPRVEVVRPAPYYAPAPYYYSPYRYYGPGHRYGHGYRRWN